MKKTINESETYEFDDNVMFPTAVDLSIDLDDALNKVLIDNYMGKSIIIERQKFKIFVAWRVDCMK